MKIADLKITNFKKISNNAIPTIVFNDDITVLVGANNAGKTSILTSIQKLFRTETINGQRDLNYLVKDGNLLLEASVTLTKEQWHSYLRLALGSLNNVPVSESDLDSLAKILQFNTISIRHSIGYINRKQSFYTIAATTDETVFSPNGVDVQLITIVRTAINILANSDIYNVYYTPLYLDSKGEIQDQEKFIPLNEIKHQKLNGNKVNIRGLLYSLKKEQPIQFKEFKERLLEIFTELNNIDVINNEELGQFDLILSEKLKKNGDSEVVNYDITNVGQGMQTLVLMLSNILLLKPGIVLMDEPEVHMHPSLIKDFIKYIKKLSKDIQFIITTHSVVLMNEVGLDKIFSLKYEAEQKGVIATAVENRNQLLDAVNALGYNVDALTYTLKPKVFVFTEGPSDKDLLLAFASKKGLSHELNVFTVGFISMGGKGNRYKLADLIDKMNKEFIDAPLIMLLDKDEIAMQEVEDIREKFFRKNPRRLFYLKKRQIENYLLDVKAIASFVIDRIKTEDLKEKWHVVDLTVKFLEYAELQKDNLLNNYLSEIFIGDSLINTHSIRQIIKSLGPKPLTESVREFKGEMAKLITIRTDDLGQKSSTAITEFEKKWNDNNAKLEMVDGRELLSSLRRWILAEFKVSFSNTDIINEMKIIPDEINLLLEQLIKPEELVSTVA